MIQFCNRATYADLTVAAKRLKFISTNIFNGGLMSLNDKQVQECIYEHVKAKSPDDYITKLRSVRFRIQNKDEGFTPDASNSPELLAAATYYTHIFRRTMELITERCDSDFIPPVYKEGKTNGLVDYYLAPWPNDSGNILYSRLSVTTPALRVARSIPEFSDLFLEKIEPLTKVKQDYDDINSMLKRRHEKSNPNNPPTQSKSERFKSFDRNKPKQILKKERMHLQFEPHAAEETLEEFEETIAQLSQHDIKEDDGDYEEVGFEHSDPDHASDEGDLGELNALTPAKPGAMKESSPPCWWKFMNGSCTKDGCRLDHSERAMQELREKKLRELATAKYGPKAADVMPTFNRYATQKTLDGGGGGKKV